MNRLAGDPDNYCDICHGPCCGHGYSKPTEEDRAWLNMPDSERMSDAWTVNNVVSENKDEQ